MGIAALRALLAAQGPGLRPATREQIQAALYASDLVDADPSAPLDDTTWIVREGTSPSQSVAVKARIAGETVTVAEITR